MVRPIFLLTLGATLITAGVYRVDILEYKGWNHVKSMVIFDRKHPLFEPFGGIHHVYANDIALEAVRRGKGRKFPDGSVLVFLLYEVKEAGGAYLEGRKKIEAFMVKDSERFRETGGWGFYAYDSSGRNLVRDMKKDCFSCHAQVRDMDYVFSVYKE
jgi:hypothetical protein